MAQNDSLKSEGYNVCFFAMCIDYRFIDYPNYKQELAKRVAVKLYRDLQRNIDEPLSISHLTRHLKQRMNWDDQKVKKLHESMDLSTTNVDYQDIVEYLSHNKSVTKEMETYFLNHPPIAAMVCNYIRTVFEPLFA